MTKKKEVATKAPKEEVVKVAVDNTPAVPQVTLEQVERMIIAGINAMAKNLLMAIDSKIALKCKCDVIPTLSAPTPIIYERCEQCHKKN